MAFFSQTVRAIRKACPTRIDAIRELIGRCPIFGICLGHQILGLALGFSSL